MSGQVILIEAMALAQTDEDALELIVRQNARLVYRIAFSVLRNHHDAEDATQETFLRALRYRRKLAGVHDPRTWLAKIAWRIAVGKKGKTLDSGPEDADGVISQLRSKNDAADEEVLAAEMSRLLQNLITRLPKKLREPLILSTLEEISTLDIAETLGISEAAVRSRLFRARQILRERLEALTEGKI